MKKISFLLIVSSLFFGDVSHLHAQILNGSFATGDFTGWTTLGAPSVLTGSGPTPPMGTTEAWIQSTDSDTGATSVSALTIDAALGVTLPGTLTNSDYPLIPVHQPVNGQAIYQTFTLSSEETLSFAYSFQTNDNAPFDSTGYVLNGVYTQLAQPTLRYFEPIDPTPTPYSIVSLDLGPGTYTLGFVAYNTGDNTASTSLYVSDVDVPEPSEWMLIALGSLVLAATLRSRFFAGR